MEPRKGDTHRGKGGTDSYKQRSRNHIALPQWDPLMCSP